MKVVRIENGVVAEIIPDYALPVAEWYNEEFAAQCVDAPDEVEQLWLYDAETETFSEPPEDAPLPPVEPTLDERVSTLETELNALLNGEG